MKFSEQFEYHKIPEWYSEYLDYKFFKDQLKHFRTKVTGNNRIYFNYFIIDGELTKLRGLYTLTNKRFVIPMDILEGTEHAKDNPRQVSNSNTITIRQLSSPALPKIEGAQLSENQ
jgi:hypothetical protein